jgi:galactokinase
VTPGITPQVEIPVLIDAHRQRFGTEPEVIAFAPGRINLIGEHTDYNGGFVMPAAIDRGIWVTATRTQEKTTLHSEGATGTGEGQPFDAPTVQKGDLEGWATYPAGMAWVLRDTLGLCPNIQATVHSNLPMGSGVSSSAAMEMVFGQIWHHFAGQTPDPKQLALLGQKCENQFVGVNCGVMDQMASACGKDQRAVFIDTRSLEIEYAEIPADLCIVLCDTKKPRALTEGTYNQRVAECKEAATIIGVAQLRDAILQQVEDHKKQMSDVVYRRARHVVTEDARTAAFKEALADGDYVGIGALMRGSHNSLKNDYEVSCEELDIMAEAAWTAPGCVGARMTGAGFGGACVALVERSKVDDFIPATLQRYQQESKRQGEAMVANPVEGARVVWSAQA